MIWIALSVIAVIVLVYTGVDMQPLIYRWNELQPNTMADKLPMAKIPLYFEYNNYHNIPTILGIGLLILLIGLLIVYIDSRTALHKLRNNNRQYKVLNQQIGAWHWNDTVNASRFNYIAQLPVLLARLVVWIFLILLIVALVLWGIHAYVWYPLPLYPSILIFLYLIHPFALMAFAYAVIVLIAQPFHHIEQTFHDDYAIMQTQPRN